MSEAGYRPDYYLNGSQKKLSFSWHFLLTQVLKPVLYGGLLQTSMLILHQTVLQEHRQM